MPTWECIDLKCVDKDTPTLYILTLVVEFAARDGGQKLVKLTVASANASCHNHAVLNLDQQSTSGSTLDNGRRHFRYVRGGGKLTWDDGFDIQYMLFDPIHAKQVHRQSSAIIKKKLLLF